MNELMVAIWMVTYNHEAFIDEALQGIINQKADFKYKVFIGEDFSSDKTKEICLRYQKEYPDKVELITRDKNIGNIANALDIYKVCFDSSAKYIAMCEGDDYWTDTNKLQKQVDVLEKNPQYVGSFHETETINEEREKLEIIYGGNTENIVKTDDLLTTKSLFHTSSFLFRRKYLELPNWFGQTVSADMALFTILSSKGNIIKVDGKMSVYRKHKMGYTNTDFVKNTLHQNRIALMRKLDNYLNYQHQEKINKVIQHHKEELMKNISDSNEFDPFLNPPFTEENLDRYYTRKSILEALTSYITEFKGHFLDVGCGKMPYKNYIIQNSLVEQYVGLDIEEAIQYDEKIKADFTWDGINMPFSDASFDSAMATEVLEHCPEPEIVLKELHRVLKPHGLFFFTVPFLWNLHEAPHDEYRYTPWALERHIKNSGFSYVEIKGLGGWHASLAQMLGLWVRRSQITEKKKKVFSKLLKPIIHQLIKRDIKPQGFGQETMMTGLYGIAIK
ncbi:glycosyltransferase (plasmid) [Bernardetia sp. Wsw4-3y2]|uniref:glycosyltransferase n=1 Tax=Bernardetia sp. Wsw4-3y2 TaxID=3127471 RepID=UPI0030CE5121